MEKRTYAIREVILDAMTEYRTSGITVTPGITWPNKPNYERPIVTCNTTAVDE